MRMIGILPAILLALAATNPQDQVTAKADDPTEKMLLANERALQEAVAKGDESAFLSLVMLPEGAWTSKQGFIPMELLVKALADFEIASWDIVNPRVTRLGEDSALVRYVWTGTGRFHNHPLPTTTLACTVWSKRSGKWLAVHHQETDLIKE